MRLVDEGCAGEALARIRVVSPLEVAPRGVALRPGRGFTFQVSGGSGALAFELATDGSGAALDAAGAYLAGARTGRDVVRVSDPGTGEAVDVPILVDPAATFAAQPGRVALPVGAAVRLTVEGGSGHLDLADPSGHVALEDDRLVALQPGTTTATLTDRFLGDTAELWVQVAAPLQVDADVMSDALSASFVLTPGDLDGDGHDEVLIGVPEADVAAGNGGAVLLYRGAADGFDPVPAQVIGGDSRDMELGRGMALGDADGDGRGDLFVGARRANIGLNDTGAVMLHLGRADGTFSPTPDRVFGGLQAGDNLGMSVAVCDFDGDGRDDLAAGAWLYEDRDVDPRANEQGGVLVWLGQADGYGQQPDQILVGQLWSDGAWRGVGNLRMGWSLAAADFDGDGACDLAVGAPNAPIDGRSNSGYVFVYRGRPPEGDAPGGLDPLPVRVVAGDDPADVNGNWGRRLAAGDLDGDGRAELVVGQYAGDRADSNSGLIAILPGRPLPAAPAEVPESILDLDWIATGSRSDQLGIDVAIGDATGDGRPDLLAGAWLADVPGAGDAGGVFVWPGVDGALPDPAAPQVVYGPEGNALLGESVGAAGGLVVARAARDDVAARDAGGSWALRVGEEAPVARFDEPRTFAAARYGVGAALLGDVDGDGTPDAVVGAPDVTLPAPGIRSGAAWLYGQGDPAPRVRLGDHGGHSGFDAFGEAVGPAGDVDGDGRPDFAVLARDEERPGNLDDTFVFDDDCPPQASNGGALYVYRGRADGAPPTAPALVWYVDRAGARMQAVAGGADVNGDGYDDLLLGSLDWDAGANNTGGVALVAGRAAEPDGRTRVICAPLLVFEGPTANDQMGRSVAALGDVDGDGCDEVAFGASGDDTGGLSNQGAVYVLFGWGGPRCPATPQVVKLQVAQSNAQLGYALAAGDVDGDGAPDLVAGAVGHRHENQTVGGAWISPGAYLRTLPRTDLATAALAPGVPAAPDDATWVVHGEAVDERAGSAVAVVGGRVAVGAIFAEASGTPLVGVVRVHPVGPAGVEQRPWALIHGETWRPGGRVGEVLSARGDDLLVAGWDGQGAGLDAGSAYWVRLPAR